MGSGLLITVSIALVASVVLLILALRAGKDQPRRRWAFIVGLVLFGMSVGLHLALAIAVTVRLVTHLDAAPGQALLTMAPIAVGTAALVVCLVSALWRPVWTGGYLLGTVVAIPAVLWLLQSLLGDDLSESIPPEVLLMTYSLPTAVIAGALVLSGSNGIFTRPDAG